MVKLLLSKKMREKNRTRIYPLLIFKSFAIGFLAKRRNNFVPESNYHHVVPVSRIPDSYLDILDDSPYLRLTRTTHHQQYHDMFDNRTPKEIILCVCRRLKIIKKINPKIFRDLNKTFTELFYIWRVVPDNLHFSNFERHCFDAFCESKDIEKVFEIIFEMFNLRTILDNCELYNPDPNNEKHLKINSFLCEIRRISQELKK